MKSARRPVWNRWLLGGLALLLGLVLICGLCPRPDVLVKKGPSEFQFAVHRVDMAVFGSLLVLAVAAVPERPRRKRRRFLALLRRGLGIRILLVILGGVIMKSVAAFGSSDYWDHSTLTALFHVLGPARMAARESLVISGMALCYSSEIVNTVLLRSIGEVPKVYVFLTVDAFVFAWIAMAVERGLAPVRVMAVVARIAFTVALTSIPLAMYGGLIGFWGVEPFAWFFSLLALVVLVSAAHRD